MKTKGLLFGLVAMLMSAVLLTSCQKEEELEDKLLQDCCWEGTLPIREHSGETKEYSRFFFYWENGYGYGIEDVYVRGEYSETYNFAWYWLDEPGGYKCLALNYGGRHTEDISVIRIRKIKAWLYGWYYASLHDWELDRDANLTTRGHAIELESTGAQPHGAVVKDDDTNKDSGDTGTDDGTRDRSATK